MRVLSLDIATTCGVAFGEAGATPRAWSVDLGKRLGDRERFSKTISLTRWACERFKPDLIAIEAPIGGKTTSHLLVGMWACAMGEATRIHVPVEKCDISSVRKHFLGKHLTAKHFPHLPAAKAKAEIKRSVMNRCKALGWEVDDHDAADAAAIWDYACAVHAGMGHETTPLFSGAQHG
jgi:hypothetical protein